MDEKKHESPYSGRKLILGLGCNKPSVRHINTYKEGIEYLTELFLAWGYSENTARKAATIWLDNCCTEPYILKADSSYQPVRSLGE